jgi:hypothetical protein
VLIGEGEGVPLTFQNGATDEHVDDLCADVGSETPEALGLSDGQTETRHLLKLGADTDGKMLNIHQRYGFLQFDRPLLTRSGQTDTRVLEQ